MARKKVIILGAGLSGLSVAFHLHRKKTDFLLFEKENKVGGLCRSKNVRGFTFDYAGHLLHFRHNYTARLVKSLLGGNLERHKRSAWIYSLKRYTPYPFQANLFSLPKKVAEQCLLDFIRVHNNGLKSCKDNNFEAWLYHTFGRGIAKYFMVPYNRKFWTVPANKLTTDWIDGFIPVPSLGQIVEGTLGRSKELFGYNSYFWYPRKGGIGQLPFVLSRNLKNIYTDCKIVSIDTEKKEIIMQSRAKEKFDCLISTLPLPELGRVISSPHPKVKTALKRLRWNSIYNLNLGSELNGQPSRHWVYFPEENVSFYRLGYFSNFSSSLAPAGKSALYIEVAYSTDIPLDKSGIIERIKGQLLKINLIHKKDTRTCIEDVNDIEYGYPIYDNNYQDSRTLIMQYLREKGILSCGRYGSWSYMSMDDVIMEGKEVADRL